jgi:hypothetical protein
MAAFKVGDRFHWSGAETGGEAEVLEVRTDRQEGMSEEVEDYAALWLTARVLGGSQAGQTLTFVLGSDDRAYLDGKPVSVTRE